MSKKKPSSETSKKKIATKTSGSQSKNSPLSLNKELFLKAWKEKAEACRGSLQDVAFVIFERTIRKGDDLIELIKNRAKHLESKLKGKVK